MIFSYADIAIKLNGVKAKNAKRHALVLNKLTITINENHRKRIFINPNFRLRMNKIEADIALEPSQGRKFASYKASG